MIKLLVPKMPNYHRLLPYLCRIDENKWYSNFGPLERELRWRLEEKYGAHIVTVSSCTAGLELMYRHYRDLGNISIELPSLTFPATVLAAKREGLWIEFEDVDPLTWTHPTVAGFGFPETGAWLDAAAAFGEQAVAPGQTAVFSLHATKAIGAGEGGYIVTHDKHLADELRRQTNFGFVDGVSLGWGTNAKMSEYACAVALASLDAWDREPWLRLFDWYDRYLPVNVTTQARPRGVYPIIAVKLPPTVLARDVALRMTAKGVETRRWYCPPMHRHPMMAEVNRNLPITDELSLWLLGLPYHLLMQETDVIYVCDALVKAISNETDEKIISS